MGKATSLTLSAHTQEALRMLGQLIRANRLERGISMQDLARRAGVSRWSVQRVEQGDPACSIGTAFELAILVGVALFEPEPSRFAQQQRHLEARLALLPKTAKTPEDEVDDDF